MEMTNQDTADSLAGTVERVVYYNADTGFCVLRVRAKGHKELVTILGNATSITVGEYIKASGVWSHNPFYGVQFKAQFLRKTPPTSLDGIKKYLGSGLIKGIGLVHATKLVAAFGDKVFDIIETSPHRLNEVPGMGRARVKMILKGWEEQRVIHAIMVFLHSHNVSTARAVRIYKTYGDRAIELITANPYRLARDIRGIGFISADAIAQSLGIEKASLVRARAGITYVLTNAMNEGHCGLPVGTLVSLCQELLDIPLERITQALGLECEQGHLIQDTIDNTRCVFLSRLFYAEQDIAQKLLALTQHPVPWSLDAGTFLHEEQTHTSVMLSSTQKAAVDLALTSKVLVITGGPGVGKTTLIMTLLTILQSQTIRIALAAPTGRAAKRLKECTGHEAKTLHRLLKPNLVTGGFSKNEESPLECDLLIIDEVSMVDVPLMHAVLKALPVTAALILVGDVDQLPSVGPGHVLRDLIQSHTVPVIRLTEIFRQAATSQIITAAHAINQGHMPRLTYNTKDTKTAPLSDFYFIPAKDPEDALSKIITVLKDRIPATFGFAHTDIQVLSPMGKGIVGTKNINVALQQVLNPPTEDSLTRFGWTYSVGDRVMQIENNYTKQVYNGDIGTITAVSPKDGEVTITYDNRPVEYALADCDEIVLAYGITIHKSQGSEYPVVIIPVMMQHYVMLKRNLLYTALTRGKKLVIMVGEEKALAIAVKAAGVQKRWSSLRLRLESLAEKGGNGGPHPGHPPFDPPHTQP